MLNELRLNNIAVFKQQTLALSRGMTVIAGEAGAGKSLLIDSLDWIFGASVSAKDVLRHDAERGLVSAVFQVTPYHALGLWNMFDHEGIEVEGAHQHSGEIEITRDFTQGGSRFKINGTSVSRKFMQELRPFLMELQSQHSTVGLMNQAVQQSLLDGMGGDEHKHLLDAVARVHLQWKESAKALDAYSSEQQNVEQRVHLLRLQVADLDALEITDAGEDTTLEEDVERLSHAEQLKQAYGETQAMLLGGDEFGESTNVMDSLGLMRKRLGQVEASEKRLSPLLEQLEVMHEQMREMAQQLTSLDEDIDVTPQRVDEIQTRLSDLQKMKRLYGPSLQDVMTYHENASFELADLEFRQANPDALKEEVARLTIHLNATCSTLTSARQVLAESLTVRVNKTLVDLAMPFATFDVVLEPCSPNAQGAERVVFHLSANPGETLKPLGKVASGGELSRVLLALTVASVSTDKETSHAPIVYVFDEIDTGTSGQAAKTIGQQLQRLSESGRQVMCVTHQPIVAAAAHHHWWVSKQVEDGETTSSVNTSLDAQGVQQVLMHLASGDEGESSTASRDFAQSLLDQMKSEKRIVV